MKLGIFGPKITTFKGFSYFNSVDCFRFSRRIRIKLKMGLMRRFFYFVFLSKINLFKVLDLSKILPDERHSEWLKVAVWIFKEWDIFGPKNVKIEKLQEIYSIDFPVMFCDDKHLKGITFVRATLIMPKEPFFRRLPVQF